MEVIIKMANVENLTRMGKNRNLSTDEAQKIGSIGGKASVEAKRERKKMREQIQQLLELPLVNKNSKEQIKALGIDDKDIDNQMALIISMFQKALKGDTKAFELLRDTIGEKPKEEIEIKEVDTDWYIED